MDLHEFPLRVDGYFTGAKGEQYQPVRVLGRGSFGTCVLVRPSNCLAPVTDASLRVVKTVDLLSAAYEHTDESIVGASSCRYHEALREAEVLKSLRHPNIIGYEDAFLSSSHLCIVMEYADGGDLAAAIECRRKASRRYHEREAMAIFAQIASALCYVHERRIMHRDLKSQNVFLTSDGVVKLGDFGVAKVLAASENCAATRIGTPQCVPPELCENHPYDFKADVWCLGVIFYQLLALECPFSATSFAALAVRICTAEPRPVSPVYSPEARALLSRLLAKKAEDRPSSASILAMPHVRRCVAAIQRPAFNGGSLLSDIEASANSLVAQCDEISNVCSPLRVLRRRNMKVLRRVKTTPDVSSPDLFAKAHALQKPVASPQKSKSVSSPRKMRFAREPKSPKKRLLTLATHALPSVEEVDMDARTSPGSIGSVSDLLAAFLLESPAGGNSMKKNAERTQSSRSGGAETANTCDGGSIRRSDFAVGANDSDTRGLREGGPEDNATCTMLLNALEEEFGLACS